MFKKCFLLFSMAVSAVLSAQEIKSDRILSFEESDIPSFIKADSNSELSFSGKHFKMGKQSLLWKFNGKSVLTLDRDLGFEPDEEGKALYLSTFITWIYNEKPIKEPLKFKFYKDNKLCSSFSMNLDFTGWRAAWVTFERDMEGKPEVGMNRLEIQAPEEPGELYFDHLITATKTDARQQTADLQVPFVNPNTSSHWLVLYECSRIKPDLSLESVTVQDKKDIAQIERRFIEQLYSPGKLTEAKIKGLRKQYDSFRIKRSADGTVTGDPVFYKSAAEAYEFLIPDWEKQCAKTFKVGMRAYFSFMNQVAVSYLNAEKEEDKAELRKMFISLFNHITDQGVAYGSCFGNIHHYGYSFRSYYTSCFLMKQVLLEEGLLKTAEKAMQWYAMVNEVNKKPEGNGISMDAFNTTTTGRAASILIMEDSPEKVRYLKSFKRWLDYGCFPAPGLADSFKSDGGAFHHCNNYPAYAVGGLDGATNMIYLLSRTRFALDPSAQRTVRKVMMTMRFYCNTLNYPLSMSARHPTGQGRIKAMSYAKMALSGTPDGKEAIDKEMGDIYLRLAAHSLKSGEYETSPEQLAEDKNREVLFKKRILEAGCTAEDAPQGNITLGYGCVSAHRRGEWCVTVRGESRYLWGSEHYANANFYGRYLGYGVMQIATSKDEKTITPLSSGWQEEGFDWGRIFGTTAIHLSVDRLRATISKVDAFSGIEEMLYSDEYFAGGLSQEGKNGNFAIKLHEHDKYNGSHRARKSYHFFGNEIVCLGTDIENIVSDCPTETTIFQLVMKDDEEKNYWPEILPSDRNYCIDHLGNGYYYPKSELPKIRFEKNLNQRSLRSNTGEPTYGDWVLLVVSHGNAPKGESYEYAVLPKTSEKTVARLASKPDYKVLRQDGNAHIVRCGELTSYALFETPDRLPEGIVEKTDTACLLMTKAVRKNDYVLTVCNPDLALYRGPSDETYDENGKRVERSIYSRPWNYSESLEVPVTVTLKGRWTVTGTDAVEVLSSDKKETVIRVKCREAKSYDISLRK